MYQQLFMPQTPQTIQQVGWRFPKTLQNKIKTICMVGFHYRAEKISVFFALCAGSLNSYRLENEVYGAHLQ